jgi:predicted nucleic acid-binding protein
VKCLDTAVAIDHLRGAPVACNLLRELLDEGETVAASEVVRFELVAGVRDEEIDALELFMSILTWIPIDEEIARRGGVLSRSYRDASAAMDAADYLIAATAFALDAELLTTNVRHFPMIPGLEPAY